MGSWQLDPYHTQVEFSARHLGMTVRGHFAEVATTGDIDPEHPFNDPGMRWAIDGQLAGWRKPVT